MYFLFLHIRKLFWPILISKNFEKLSKIENCVRIATVKMNRRLDIGAALTATNWAIVRSRLEQQPLFFICTPMAGAWSPHAALPASDWCVRHPFLSHSESEIRCNFRFLNQILGWVTLSLSRVAEILDMFLAFLTPKNILIHSKTLNDHNFAIWYRNEAYNIYRWIVLKWGV